MKMNFGMSRKARGLMKSLVLVVFMGGLAACSSSKDSTASSSTSSATDVSTDDVGENNQFLIPPYQFNTLTTGEPLGTCAITNVARDSSVTVNERVKYDDCSNYCLKNRQKFARDPVTCSFTVNGWTKTIAGGYSSTYFTEKNHCKILSGTSTVVDSYHLDFNNCINECQVQGEIIYEADSLICLWQNRRIYSRTAGSATVNKVGNCVLSVAYASLYDTVVTLNYNGSVTQGQCTELNTQLTDAYADIGTNTVTITTSADSPGGGFTEETPVSITLPVFF